MSYLKFILLFVKYQLKLKAQKRQRAQNHAWGLNIKHISFLNIMRA